MFKFLILASAVVILYRIFLREDDFDLPKKGITEIKKVKRVIEDKEDYVEVQRTSGLFHKIPFCEIIKVGPRKDGIPTIDKPKFISFECADKFLNSFDQGIAIKFDGVSRFYPLKILMWHQVVNDIIGNKRVLVSYCPLCFTGTVFNPIVGGEQTEFGTSGRVWNSNLLIYDRKTQSLWSQISGEAICGRMTGSRLSKIYCEQITYAGFKKNFPKGEILSRKTGFFRFYDENPYHEYHLASEVFFPIKKKDERLPNRDLIFGITFGDIAKAYSLSKLREERIIKDSFANKKIVAKYNNDTGAASLFEEHPQKGLIKLSATLGFWFSWVAIYPQTELYK